MIAASFKRLKTLGKVSGQAAVLRTLRKIAEQEASGETDKVTYVFTDSEANMIADLRNMIGKYDSKIFKFLPEGPRVVTPTQWDDDNGKPDDSLPPPKLSEQETNTASFATWSTNSSQATESPNK
jgi:hypothetical protein